MTTEGPRRGRKCRFRRVLLVVLLFLIGLSVPVGVYWSMEKTEHRIRATEGRLMEELALLRAEVAALSQQQRASQEAVEQLTVRTEALLHLWQAQVDRSSSVPGPGTEDTIPSSGDGRAAPVAPAMAADEGAEDGEQNSREAGDTPF